MKTYYIESVSSYSQIDWEKIKKAPVDTYLWLTNGYKPETYAQLVFVKDYGFVAKMTSAESNPRAVCQHTDDLVCFDSCLEFFAQFVNGDDRYVNIEMNPNGVTLSAIGSDRYDRKSVYGLTGSIWEVISEKTPTTWSVTAKIPMEKLCNLYHANSTCFVPGYRFRGNFYKCGDSCEIPHYGMWNPVELDSPDFHCPTFFGQFEIK